MVTVFGIVASSLTTACWAPQVYRTLHTHSAKDFSWPYLLIFTIGISGWVVYGLMLHNYIIWVSNGIVELCALSVIAVKVHSPVNHSHTPIYNSVNGAPE